MTWQVLLERQGGTGIPDVAVHGAVAWATPQRVLHEIGGDVVCFGRSMLKPLVIKGVANTLEPATTWEQRAISVASHMGTAMHVDVVRSLLSQQAEPLHLPPSAPLRLPGEVQPASHLVPTPAHNPCSGQHAAILCACALRGWQGHDYCARTHPMFASMHDVLSKRLDASTHIAVAADNCGLATFAVSIGDQARLMASLVAERDDDWVWTAMTTRPDLIGGEGRLDTALMTECAGRVVAKEGADGLLGLSIVHDDFPDGLGIVIKLAHGWDPSTTREIATHLLRHLGFPFDDDNAAPAQKLSPQLLSPQLLSSQLRSPQLLSPQLLSPQLLPPRRSIDARRPRRR